MRPSSLVLASSLLQLWGTPLHGQVSDPLAAPVEDWMVRLDRSGAGDPPRLWKEDGALRIRTGAAGIAYVGDAQVAGPYRIDMTITQFDPGGRNEGYGLFVGGSGLQLREVSYVYVLIRQDGQTLVKRRAGKRTPVVRDWTPAPDFERWSDRPQGSTTITNDVTLAVGEGGIRFEVNGVEVFLSSAGKWTTDGIFGLRVNHGLDVRIDRLVITESEPGRDTVSALDTPPPDPKPDPLPP